MQLTIITFGNSKIITIPFTFNFKAKILKSMNIFAQTMTVERRIIIDYLYVYMQEVRGYQTVNYTGPKKFNLGPH